jgi:hypothetical protein
LIGMGCHVLDSSRSVASGILIKTKGQCRLHPKVMGLCREGKRGRDLRRKFNPMS